MNSEPSVPNRTTLAETKFLKLIQQQHWTFAQRPNVTGAIAVLALTDAREVVLIEQFRIPTNSNVIELPAGLVGDTVGFEQESLVEAARRELMEETGYDAETIETLVQGASSAGLTDERVHLLFATGLKKVGPGGGDASEQIQVNLVSVDCIDDWLDDQIAQNKDIDFKVLAALYFLRRLGEAANR